MDFTKTRRFMDSLGDYGIPGADLAIYIDGNEVFRYLTGFANLENRIPVASDTLFPIFSMTKVVTCVAALRLFEEGRFLLSDPLSDYMPEFKKMKLQRTLPNGTIVLEPARKKIRIVDLFTMSSGYTYDSPSVTSLREKHKRSHTLRDMVSFLAKDPLNFEPGTHWSYGFSHDILGALIEKLSGKTIGEYFSEHIFVPLGMNETSFKVPKEKHYRLATCYKYNEDTKTHTSADVTLPLSYLNPSSVHYLSDDYALEMPGGGLISTVDDYAKFANTLCAGGTSTNGYRLLGKATIELMRTNQLDDVRMGDYNWISHEGYGYGLGVRTLVDRAAAGNNSSIGEFGWAGLAGTYMLIDPALRLTYVYAQQMFPSMEEVIAPRLKNIVYGCI